MWTLALSAATAMQEIASMFQGELQRDRRRRQL
jgi:hypothetical protein